jgi:hypothetical protein
VDEVPKNDYDVDKDCSLDLRFADEPFAAHAPELAGHIGDTLVAQLEHDRELRKDVDKTVAVDVKR